MAFYYVSLAGSLVVNAGLAYYKHISTRAPSKSAKTSNRALQQEGIEDYDSDSDWSTATVDNWAIISRQYLTVYALAVGADWLQVRRASQ